MELQEEINILEDFWSEQPLEERKDQVDMIMANYVTCSGVEGTVFDELDESPEEMFDAEEKFEVKAVTHLRKYRSMLDKYHFLLTQESMVSIFQEKMF